MKSLWKNLNKQLKNIIEIWDKESYEKAVSIDYEDFGKKTEEILGKFYGAIQDLQTVRRWQFDLFTA